MESSSAAFVDQPRGAVEAFGAVADHFGRLTTVHDPVRALFDVARRVALSNVPVIITGETGTGKELLAEALHAASARRNGPFVVFDCTAIAPTLLEAALFGHEKGAFTGALATREGVFERAHGGTLFIDEIGELDIALQSKLLRAIERAQVQRVGASAWRHVDVRIVCATRRDLGLEVSEGRFRDDLFYRLGVSRLHLPPLRERGGDAVWLARLLWKQAGGHEPLPEEVLARIARHPWPGNVRQLQNFLLHLRAVGEARFPDQDPPSSSAPVGSDYFDRVIADCLPFVEARERVLREFTHRYCENALERHHGNVTKASAASGVARRYFYVLRSRGR